MNIGRMFLLFLSIPVISAVVLITLWFGMQVAAPFFVEFGDAGAIFGVEAGEIISMGSAARFAAMSLLVMPLAALVMLFIGGRQPQPRSPPRPR